MADTRPAIDADDQRLTDKYDCADDSSGRVDSSKKDIKKKKKVAIAYEDFGQDAGDDGEVRLEGAGGEGEEGAGLEGEDTGVGEGREEDDGEGEGERSPEKELYVKNDEKVREEEYQKPAELITEDKNVTKETNGEIQEEELDEKRDVTDDICEIQFKCIPLLKDYRHNKLTILAYIEHQTQLMRSIDPSKYLFPYGAQNLRSKLTIFNDFLSKLASTIECESIIATAEFLCQIDKLSELLNKFLELNGGKAFIVTVINTMVDFILLLDNTLLAKHLTIKLHVISLKYSYVLKDSLENVLEFLEKKRVVLYHQEQMASEEKVIVEVQFNRILRDIELNKHIRECAPENCANLEQQYNLFSKLYPYYLKRGLTEFFRDQPRLIEMFREAISVCSKMLFQTTYRFSFEKGGVHETKTFSVNKEREVMLDFPEVYYPISILINELLIRPDLSEFHEPALTLIRRLYFNFEKIRDSLAKPIMILLTNIRMFGSEESKKQAAIFLYQLLHQVNDSNISTLLEKTPLEGSDESSAILTRHLQSIA